MNGWEWQEQSGDTQSTLGGLTAMVHSTLLLLPTLSLLLSHPTKKPSAPISASSDIWNWKAWSMISWCQAYMLQDAFWILKATFSPSTMSFSPSSSDIMFLAHHLATTFYMATAKSTGAGHYSCMTLMWFGEVTNPIHNSYEIVKTTMKVHPGPNIALALPVLGKAFAATYGFVRIVLGPILAVWVVYDLLLTKSGRKDVGWVGVLWAIMVVGVIHGSMGFAFDYALEAW
ncbi:hypothetical protein TrRE_jg3152 [Triparma retinervis]|uniref:TLC domain-containing protein n=1 Tax=Triparma retinervis TaxID=2557542 RepID=A0A9W7FWH2_9STRA|nr:hypothetical protein TrRE_jg3152 [Triparma retinervis]